MKEIEIETPCGIIKGIREDQINKFLGIRYGTAGRWEYPREVTSWEGVYSALHFGAAPVQKRAFLHEETREKEFFEHEFMNGVHAHYSEDCLFLNVWAPAETKNCPVLIVIYGGGLVSGQTDELELDGSRFAQKGVVVVTLNYRVNVFGFLAMKELEDENGKSGNYGYYDQYTAIQWVKHNIKSFGGNPEKMTLIGQSAGAASAETQIKSPLNRGVFQGAIIQSSAGFVSALKAKDNRENAYRRGKELFDQSGCATIAEFRKMPAEELFHLFERLSAKNPIGYTTAVFDENFTGREKNRPCETNIICSLTSQDVMPPILYFLCKALARSQKKSAVTYGYFFSRQLPGDDFGAWHSSDLWYTYGSLNKCWRPFTEKDDQLSERMMEYFVQFIKTGNPNREGLPCWEPLTKKRFMIFDIGKCKMGRPKIGGLIKEMFFSKGPGMGM